MRDFDDFLKYCDENEGKIMYDTIDMMPSKESFRGFPSNLTETDIIMISKLQVKISKNMLKYYHIWLNGEDPR